MPQNIINSLFLLPFVRSFVCLTDSSQRTHTHTHSAHSPQPYRCHLTIPLTMYTIVVVVIVSSSSPFVCCFSIIHCCRWLLTYLFGSCYFVVSTLLTWVCFYVMWLWRRDSWVFDVVILSVNANRQKQNIVIRTQHKKKEENQNGDRK